MDEQMNNQTPENQPQQEAPTPEPQPQPTPPQTEQPATPKDEMTKEAKQWAMFCHLAGLAGYLPVIPLIGSILGPLIIWLIKKDESSFIDDQGKEALNFQITIGIGVLICIPLFLVFIGFLLLPALTLFNIVMIIIASIESNKGNAYRYPINLRLVK